MKCNTTIDIDTNLLNNAIQGAVSNALKQSDIKDKLYSYGVDKIRTYAMRAERDGRLVQSVAKEISHNIPVDKILELLDVKKLETKIIERVSEALVTKMQNKLLK